jgi:hypothetical protein
LLGCHGNAPGTFKSPSTVSKTTRKDAKHGPIRMQSLECVDGVRYDQQTTPSRLAGGRKAYLRIAGSLDWRCRTLRDVLLVMLAQSAAASNPHTC